MMKKAAKLLFGCVILLLSVAGCRTARLPAPQLIVKDSVVYKDTTVFVEAPPVIITGDTAWLIDTIPCPDINWQRQQSSASGRTKIGAVIENGRISIECQTDSLIRRIDSLRAVIRLKESYQQTREKEIVTSEKPYVPWWVWLIVVLGGLSFLTLIKKQLL